MDVAAEAKALNFPTGSFAVFGSGPLSVRGLREANDVDIIVSEAFFKQLATDATWTKGELSDHHKSLTKGNVSVYDSWAPGSWDIDELIREAEIIDGVPYVKLENVLEWKDLRAKPKDIEDMKLIRQYLAGHNA